MQYLMQYVNTSARCAAAIAMLALVVITPSAFAGGAGEANPAAAPDLALEGAGPSFPAPLITAMAD